MVAAAAEVKLLGMWASPSVRRVEWGLQMKGIEYEYVEEDLANKSAALLRHNPVHKQVPVLLHGDRAVTDSLLILEYIDETWVGRPLLPRDPYRRASARFWAKFAEENCREATKKAFFERGEERSEAIEQLREQLQRLDEELEGKKFFGGVEIGFADLAVGWMAFWLGVSEEVAGFTVVDAKKLPRFAEWMDDFLRVPVIRDNLPPREKTVEFFRYYRDQQLAAAAAAK
ncbi:glutathione transferase GST 23-like [Zingiber officinale]|uniref:Glutathione S-transferase n=1 Tax=Zingiber officinale TaxID=94328 RepID=A0A8J5C3Y4_ZINOF|nr:glutathione transferase GST 23-like [Zingiber officinale]KAG6471850.1 hypothetical protein ZIOFF_069297 [Zingiber officinale]